MLPLFITKLPKSEHEGRRAFLDCRCCVTGSRINLTQRPDVPSPETSSMTTIASVTLPVPRGKITRKQVGGPP
jgi:hypothetical protein